MKFKLFVLKFKTFLNQTSNLLFKPYLYFLIHRKVYITQMNDTSGAVHIIHFASKASPNIVKNLSFLPSSLNLMLILIACISQVNECINEWSITSSIIFALVSKPDISLSFKKLWAFLYFFLLYLTYFPYIAIKSRLVSFLLPEHIYLFCVILFHLCLSP